MKSSFFRQQAATWQHKMQQQQTASWPKRLFAWLVLGLALIVSLALMMVVVLLSCLLIPLMFYRARKRMQAAQQAADSSAYSNVIEGEIVDETEHHLRR